MQAGVELTPLRTYREVAIMLLNKIINEVNNYSIPFPRRKAAFLVVVSLTKSLLAHVKKHDQIERKLKMSITEIDRELDRRQGESIDDYIERTLPLIVNVLSEVAVAESEVYPSLDLKLW